MGAWAGQGTRSTRLTGTWATIAIFEMRKTRARTHREIIFHFLSDSHFLCLYCDVLKFDGDIDAGGVPVSLLPSDASIVSWPL